MGDFHLLFFASFLAHSVRGSKTVLTAPKRHFRSPPMNGHRRSRSACLKRATNGLMHRSKQPRYSITSLARAISLSGTVSPRALAVFGRRLHLSLIHISEPT